MEWQQANGKFWTATVEAGDSIDQALHETFALLKERVLPANESVFWDYLRIELWPDSGRLIGFPASNSTSERIERAGWQVIFKDLLAQYEALADAELEDETFEEQLIACERDWIERFCQAARGAKLTGIWIKFYDADLPDVIREEHY